MKYLATHRKTPPSQPAHAVAPRSLAYWRATRRLTLWLLLCWFAITFPIIFFARQLSGLVLFGWPLSFYMAAQGTILAYVAIVGVYAWRMRALDRHFARESDDGG